MKKLISLICISFMLSGCGSDSSNAKNDTGLNSNTSVSAVMEKSVEENMPVVGEVMEKSTVANNSDVDFSALDDVEVDIDFSHLSSTMAFAQLSNMMYPYQEYIGKTVKIQGEYYLAEVPQNNMNYHFLLLMDDTNCCQGVMEFVLPEGAEYPEMGQQIRIAGEYILDIDDTGEYPVLDVSHYAF